MGYTRRQRKYLRAVGRSIRTSRLKKHLSQEDLAQLSGLHRTYIGSLERGERNISILNIKILSNALGEEIGNFVSVK